jgi:hypothetical protein
MLGGAIEIGTAPLEVRYSCESNNKPQAPVYSAPVRDFGENQSAFLLSTTNSLESLTMLSRGT